MAEHPHPYGTLYHQLMKQSEHSVFAFSASPRWIACPGSMAYPENTAEGVDGGFYADEGTAAHTLAASVLKNRFTSAASAIGLKIKAGTREFEVTEEFAGHVQTYVDDVRARAIGGYLMVEQRVTLEGIEGFDESNYGTSDAVIALPGYGIIEDLKFGQGEKVNAWEFAHTDSPFAMNMELDSTDSAEVVPNYQLMMYALACLADIRLLIDNPTHILIVINQPRLGHISELRVPLGALERFAVFASDALRQAERAMANGIQKTETHWADYLNPGEKQCRWCRALARCPAAAKHVQQEVAADFDIIGAKPPIVPVNAPQIAKALLAVPFVSDWCRAVMAKANELVASGVQVIGPDDKPYKFVEGRQGDRKWKDEKAAEAALTAQLADKAYTHKLLTAAAAAKILDKAKTKELWNDLFAPLVSRAPGRPTLALGSDPRPAFSPASSADEFEIEADWSIP